MDKDNLGNPKVEIGEKQIRFHMNAQVLTFSFVEEAGQARLLVMLGFAFATLDREQATALAKWAATTLPGAHDPNKPYHCNACQKPLAFTEATFAGQFAYCAQHERTLVQDVLDAQDRQDAEDVATALDALAVRKEWEGEY